MAANKWKLEYAITAYELARDGHSMKTIASAIGVTVTTLLKWKKKKKILRIAINRGRKFGEDKDAKAPTLKKYIYDRLPSKLKKTWDQIDALERANNGLERVQALLDSKGKKVRQHLFLYAWTQSNFSLSQALRKVCISRAAFEKWKRDVNFLELIQEIEWHKKNFFEDALVKLVRSGDSSAVIFANKAQNADRGYNPGKSMELNVKGGLNINYIDVSQLDLPLYVRKMILTQYRQSQLPEGAKQIPSKVIPELTESAEA